MVVVTFLNAAAGTRLFSLFRVKPLMDAVHLLLSNLAQHVANESNVSSSVVFIHLQHHDSVLSPEAALQCVVPIHLL